jgi:predicted nucleotidyltransferase component of viral defense system
MKTIPSELKLDIEDAANAGLLGNLPPAVAEKDIHVTDALFELSSIQLTHRANQLNRKKGDLLPPSVEVATRLVFAGGTCLSKAHSLIERMSEDIDIKVVLDPVPEGYALEKGHSDRKRLGDLHDEVERRLVAQGFQFVEMDNGENPRSRDSRRYYCLAVSYKPEFQDVSGALRPQLKLELIHRHPKLPLEQREMGYLLANFIPAQDPIRFTMTTISVAETLAEKVLSLLRRCAWKWDGHQRGEFDTALVRHVYDVWQIVRRQPDSVDVARSIFLALVKKDAEEFQGQHPEFDAQPHTVLQRTLERAKTDSGLAQNYEQRLKPLLFASTAPEFNECLATFAEAAALLIGTCSEEMLER